MLDKNKARAVKGAASKLKGIFIKEDPVKDSVAEASQETVVANEAAPEVSINDIAANKESLKAAIPTSGPEPENDGVVGVLSPEFVQETPSAFDSESKIILNHSAFLDFVKSQGWQSSSIEYAVFLKLVRFEKDRGKTIDPQLIQDIAEKVGIVSSVTSDEPRAQFEAKFKSGYVNTCINTYIADQLAKLSNQQTYFTKFNAYGVGASYDMTAENGYFAAINAEIINTIPSDVIEVAIAEANEIVDLAIKRNLPDETPVDLKEEYRSLVFANNGKPVGKLITKKDLSSEFAASSHVNNFVDKFVAQHNGILENFRPKGKVGNLAWVWWSFWILTSFIALQGYNFLVIGTTYLAALPIFFTLRFCVGFIQDLVRRGNIVNAFGHALLYTVWMSKLKQSRVNPEVPENFSNTIFAIAKSIHTKKSREHELLHRDIGDVIIDNAGKEYPLALEKARQAQIDNAINDNTKFLKLGTSTGFMSNRMDPFAPTKAGMDFGFSLNDASTHILILGGSGSGKTTGVIRPIAKSILASANEDFGRKNGIGAIVLDGKGPLPLELKDLADDYNVINPEYSVFNPIENLSASEVADGFYEMYAAGSVGKDDYWNQAAAKLIRTSGVILSLSSHEWTLHNLYKAVTDDAWIKELYQEIKTNCLENDVCLNSYEENALSYRLVEFMNLGDVTRGSYLGNATVWLSSVVDNEKLSAWGSASNGLMVEDVVVGKKFGFALPESDFGQAGQLISIFAKKRAYKAIKSRGDVWKDDPEQTAVMLIADEVQNLLTEDESAMLPIARSLGLYCVFSTQNIDGIVAAYGGSEIKANQLLGNMASMVALRSETKLTRSFISERMGSEWRTSYTKVSDSNAFQKVKNQDAQTVGATGVLDRQLDSITAELGDLIGYQAFKDADERKQNRIDDKEEKERDRVYSQQRYSIDWDGLRDERIAQTAEAELMGDTAKRIKQLELQREQLIKEKELQENIEVGISRLVGEEEIASILAVPNTALAQVVRGRVMRRDKIKLNPIYSIN